jgi:hypothetical protein
LLLQTVVSTGLPKLAALKDQAIVAMEDRSPDRAQRPETDPTGRFDSPFGLLDSTPERKFIAEHT